MAIGEEHPTRALGGTGAGSRTDLVTTEVIRHGLISGAELMRRTLCRTAFSPIIYEVVDFCCVLYDRRIRLLAQAPSLPLWLGTMHFVIEASVEAVGGEESLEPGDVLVHTGAYETGSHAQDMAVVVPAFLDGKLIGFAATKAHHLDLGAKYPYCTDTTDVFQEGLILPGIRLYRGGEQQRDLYRTIVANSRAPANLEGDLNAEIGACRIGAEALARLVAKHQIERFEASTEVMFDQGEAVIRRAIGALPDGRYIGENCLDNDGIRMDKPIPFEVEVRVEGSEITVDLAASPPEATGPVNCPLPSTVSAARFAIISAVGRHEAINEGHFRPMNVETEKGTLFDPRPPAPIFLYFLAGYLVIDAIHRSLAEVAPDTIPAGSGGDLNGMVVWRIDEDGHFLVTAADHPTGQGASRQGDGGPPLSHISCSGGRNTPVEVWETAFPHLVVDRLEMVPDSGGAGRYRGGPALQINYRALDDFSATVGVERTRLAPWGLFGGRSGLPNSLRFRRPDGTVEEIGKKADLEVPAGAIIEYRLGGGGGWGRPEERDPAAVSDDVLDGYLTKEGARREYPSAGS